MRIMPYRRMVLLMLAFSGLSPLSAQDLDCNLTSNPVDVRSGDRTALIGDIIIQCVSANPLDEPTKTSVSANIIVNFSAPTVNSPGVGYAVRVTNENNCTTPSFSGDSYACEGAYPDPEYGWGGNSISWFVKVPFPGAVNPQTGLKNPDVSTIRFTSMRANFSAYNSGNTPWPVQAIVSVEPPHALNLRPAVVELGTVRTGLGFDVKSQASGQQCPEPESAGSAVINVAEGFASAFRRQGSPSFHPLSQITESGYYAPAASDGGAADGPTKVALVFSKVPQGVTLKAPKTVQSGALSLTLDGAGCGATGAATIPVSSGGAGELVYQVCGADPSATENVDVPISASWGGGLAADAGVGKVRATLAPQTGVPSFVSTGSAATFLTIQKCVTPPPPPPPDEEDRPYLTKMSVYSDGMWLKDDNGDGLLEEEVETSFGFKGAMPLAGDWDGDGSQELAVYANIFGTGFWFRDVNGNGTWDDGIDKVSLLGWGDDFAEPVVGDWNGDGRTKLGVYMNGLWLLDYDGNGVLSANDKIFEFGGWDGSVPLVGDWNGDGRESAGIYVPGYFVLDYSADHHFENGPEDRVYEFGINGSDAVPVTGDWTGDGKKKIGIFQAGQWSLDLNGDGQAGGASENPFFFGPGAGFPVVGDWQGIGKDTIGVVDDGAWYLDANGDRVHNSLDPILFWGDEGDNRVFVPGKWQSPDE